MFCHASSRGVDCPYSKGLFEGGWILKNGSGRPAILWEQDTLSSGSLSSFGRPPWRTTQCVIDRILWSCSACPYARLRPRPGLGRPQNHPVHPCLIMCTHEAIMCTQVELIMCTHERNMRTHEPIMCAQVERLRNWYILCNVATT